MVEVGRIVPVPTLDLSGQAMANLGGSPCWRSRCQPLQQLMSLSVREQKR
jgi:hypothetical protein